MKPILRNTLLLFTLLTLVNASTAQDKLHIKFIGNCGLHLSDGATNIYTDFPYKSGAFGYMKYSNVELDSIEANSVFIFTHKHSDHYSKKIVRTLLKKRNCKKFTQWNKKKLLRHMEEEPNIDIKAFKNKHRFSFKHYSYLITWNGKRIFLSGDTESAETISQVENIDWAFVPSWLLDDAEEKGIQIDASMIGVYHLYPSEIEKSIKRWESSENIIPLTEQGMYITID